ncbi:MAG: flagellar basal-body MS-ring/collar protein FliF, partial [Selenomonas artemidis]
MGEWKERGLAMWERFDKRQRYIMLGSALAILALIFGLSFWYGSKPDMVPLFTDMETKDAGEVANQLREAKISYEVQDGKNGTTILVPTTNVHEARLNLATQGLPRGNKGFEIFDDSKLGVTEFQNRVNYLQALQGELTRTIEQIDAVEKARVHIVLPEDSLYKKEEKPATASIMLRLKPGTELTKKEIKGIVNLAAHSVKGLTPENITIVDDTGKILNDPDDQDYRQYILGAYFKPEQYTFAVEEQSAPVLFINAGGEPVAF